MRKNIQKTNKKRFYLIFWFWVLMMQSVILDGFACCFISMIKMWKMLRSNGEKSFHITKRDKNNQIEIYEPTKAKECLGVDTNLWEKFGTQTHFENQNTMLRNAVDDDGVILWASYSQEGEKTCWNVHFCSACKEIKKSLWYLWKEFIENLL